MQKFWSVALGAVGYSAALLVLSHEGTAQTVRQACAADIAQFCPAVRDLASGRACLDAHTAELSGQCRTARQAKQANSGVQNDQSSGQQVAPAASAAPAPDAQDGPLAPDGGLDTVAERIAGRSFPSMFAPWNLAENLNKDPNSRATPLSETQWANIARHDLYWRVFNSMGLRLQDRPQYLMLSNFQFTPESIQTARRNRAALLTTNPHLVILAAVSYKFAQPQNFLPPDSPWWVHGAAESKFEGFNPEYRPHLLDYANSAFQDKVAALCAALVKTGVFDGCLFDGWRDDENPSAHVALIRKIRSAIGEKALIVGNVNQRLPTATANYLNGMYMEGFGDRYFPDWRTAAANLLWGESHLHKPAITALEGFWRTGRNQHPLMREVTTLSLVFSNGYAVFDDPDELPTPDHLHDWYPFWDKSLGRPTGPLADLSRPNLNGAYARRYEHGDVVFNPPGNRPVAITFPDTRRSAATGATGRSFAVKAGDGDLFLTP